MKLFIRLTLLLLLNLLISCAHIHGSMSSKAAFATCKASCNQRASECNKMCHNNCGQCIAISRQSTAWNYTRYVHEQMVSGKTIARELNSYRDPLQCRKITCNCPADYQVCMQSCGGVIHKQLRHAIVCQ